MKGLIKNILILLLFLAHGQIMSQNSESVEFLSNIDDFTIVLTEENKYTIIPGDIDYHYNDKQDLPAIPIKNISILVPNGAELVDYDFSIQKTLITRDIDIDRSPAELSTLPSFQINQSDFTFNGLYPEKPIQFSSVSVQRGFTQFNFSFSPFIYSGGYKTLEFINQLSLNVNYKINESKVSSVHPDEGLIKVIKQRIANPQAMDRLYYKNSSLYTKTATEKIDYLIVTNEILKESFTPLVQWKNRKGLYAKIVTVEDIYQQYDESTNQLKIKRCLLDYYENNDLKWVLFGGDENVIPVQYCHNIMEKDVNENSNIPTDLFYACLNSRFDWNSHKDDKIGELFWDGHDVTPEVYLSRLPVKTIEDAEAIVRKTLEYETNPILSNSIGKIIFAGVKLYSTWQDKSDSHHRSEYIYNKYIEKNTTGNNFYFFDTGTDFNEGADHDVTSINLTGKLNDGFGFLHFTGHGDYQSLIMESGTDFDTNDAMNLTNQIGGIVFTNACWTNAFDITEPSFSEALIRNPNGGCVAYFGSSRYGFGNPEPSRELGASLKYNAKFINFIFNKKLSGSMTFGEIATFTKNELNWISNRFYSYLLYAINPIGDPELPLYSGTPQTFQNIRIYELGDLLYVQTGGVENARICITSIDMDDGFKSVAENVSFQSFENLPEHYQITITAPNYIPYTFVSGNVTGIFSNIREFINLYPNPASDYIHVDFNLPEGQLQIYSVNGKLLKEQVISYGSNNINISDLSEGFLLLNFMANQETVWFKIVKRN
jgi:hypothetical protein